MKETKIVRKSPPSVFFVNYRAIFNDGYPAKFDEELARLLIGLYSDEGEIVMDPMCGSGVIPSIAARMKRCVLAFDINPEAVQQTTYNMQSEVEKWLSSPSLSPLILENGSQGSTSSSSNSNNKLVHHVAQGDARDLRELVGSSSVDFILTSPPFGITIDAKHPGYSEIQGDITNSKTYEEWRKEFSKVIGEMHRILKPGKLFACEIKPRMKDGEHKPLNYWIYEDSLACGFEFFTEFVEFNLPYRVMSYGSEDARRPFQCHSYVLIFKKREYSSLLSSDRGRD